MAITLRYLGWWAFEMSLTDGRRILLNALLAGAPEEDVPPSPAKLEEFNGVEVVMVTHAAGDHLGQAFEILHRSQAKLVCDFATRFLALAAGISRDRICHMAPGVQFDLNGLRVKALAAQRLSFPHLGARAYISAPPLSYILTSQEGDRIFLGVGGVNVMGQSFTELCPDEAALVAKWLKVQMAIPIHYRFDEGTRFAQELKTRAPEIQAVLLLAGESYRYPDSA